jgi:hypothetical protein
LTPDVAALAEAADGAAVAPVWPNENPALARAGLPPVGALGPVVPVTFIGGGSV